MIKKIYIIIFIFLISCGKKGDPVYKEHKKKKKKTKILNEYI